MNHFTYEVKDWQVITVILVLIAACTLDNMKRTKEKKEAFLSGVKEGKKRVYKDLKEATEEKLRYA